jgi:hypothetical protein
MADPPISERHKPHFHRIAPVKEGCRAATTAPITISTALNNGDSLDGVTLATGDRVLVKDQSTDSQNGIYVVGVTPVRAYDLSTDDPSYGFLIWVRQGSTNAETLWANTNTAAPTVGSTPITFAAASGGGGLPSPSTTGDLIVWDGAAWVILPAGADGDVLTADSGDPNGLSYQTPGSGATITTKDEGSTLSGTVTTLDFTGAGVTASGSGATTTVNIPGGGGAAVQYPALKPGTPTYDFAGSALDGAFSAHSSGGSFATTDCLTQAEDWMGSALEMQYSAQMGGLYVSHADADLDFSIGGLRIKGMLNPVMMVGIAALNSAGTGVGVLAYADGSCYLATITTWNYVANSDSWGGQGIGTGTETHGDWWFRLKRVSGTWTAYASKSGRTWDKTFATRSDSITVDRLFVGMLYNTGSTYSGRITLDYLDVAV